MTNSLIPIAIAMIPIVDDRPQRVPVGGWPHLRATLLKVLVGPYEYVSATARIDGPPLDARLFADPLACLPTSVLEEPVRFLLLTPPLVAGEGPYLPEDLIGRIHGRDGWKAWISGCGSLQDLPESASDVRPPEVLLLGLGVVRAQ